MNAEGFERFDEQGGAERHDRAGSSRSELERLADDLLDGELPRARSAELFRELSQSDEAVRELHATNRAIDALREPVDTPDFVKRVMGEVGGRRGFTDERSRRWVWAGRVGVAAALVVVAGAGFAYQRHAADVSVAQSGESASAAPRLAGVVHQDLLDVSDNASRAVDRAERSLEGSVAQLRSFGGLFEPSTVEVRTIPLARAALGKLDVALENGVDHVVARVRAGADGEASVHDVLLSRREIERLVNDANGAGSAERYLVLIGGELAALRAGEIGDLRGGGGRTGAVPAELIDTLVPQSVIDGHSAWMTWSPDRVDVDGMIAAGQWAYRFAAGELSAQESSRIGDRGLRVEPAVFGRARSAGGAAVVPGFGSGIGGAGFGGVLSGDDDAEAGSGADADR
jgi:hypothetical protein